MRTIVSGSSLPEAAQRTRTHCTDIERDVARITFKTAKLLRTEDRNWRGIESAFHTLLDAVDRFSQEYEAELIRIGTDVDDVCNLLRQSQTEPARQKYSTLRSSLLTSKKGLRNEIGRMQHAETHFHKLLMLELGDRAALLILLLLP